MELSLIVCLFVCAMTIVSAIPWEMDDPYPWPEIVGPFGGKGPPGRVIPTRWPSIEIPRPMQDAPPQSDQPTETDTMQNVLSQPGDESLETNRKIMVESVTRFPRRRVKGVIDLDRNVAGLVLSHIRTCFILPQIQDIFNEKEGGASEEHVVYWAERGRVIRNHALLPEELQHECRRWPLYWAQRRSCPDDRRPFSFFNVSGCVRVNDRDLCVKRR